MNMLNNPDFLQIVTKVSSPSFVNEHVRVMLLFLVLLGLSVVFLVFFMLFFLVCLFCCSIVLHPGDKYGKSFL